MGTYRFFISCRWQEGAEVLVGRGRPLPEEHAGVITAAIHAPSAGEAAARLGHAIERLANSAVLTLPPPELPEASEEPDKEGA